jgi:hypothetical protein
MTEQVPAKLWHGLQTMPQQRQAPARRPIQFRLALQVTTCDGVHCSTRGVDAEDVVAASGPPSLPGAAGPSAASGRVSIQGAATESKSPSSTVETRMQTTCCKLFLQRSDPREKRAWAGARIDRRSSMPRVRSLTEQASPVRRPSTEAISGRQELGGGSLPSGRFTRGHASARHRRLRRPLQLRDFRMILVAASFWNPRRPSRVRLHTG